MVLDLEKQIDLTRLFLPTDVHLVLDWSMEMLIQVTSAYCG